MAKPRLGAPSSIITEWAATSTAHSMVLLPSGYSSSCAVFSTVIRTHDGKVACNQLSELRLQKFPISKPNRFLPIHVPITTVPKKHPLIDQTE